MSIKTHLKNAIAAKQALTKATAETTISRKNLEKSLAEAIVFVRSVRDAVTVHNMTDQKELKLHAWTKAVMFLGSSPSDFKDLILVLSLGHGYTQKEADIRSELYRKKDLIWPKNLTAEQLHIMFTHGGDHEMRVKARNGLKDLLNECNDPSELERWREAYEDVRFSDYSPSIQFWDDYAYNHAYERLKSCVED